MIATDGTPTISNAPGPCTGGVVHSGQVKDTSSPSRPAVVKPNHFGDGFDVWKPTGGLLASFCFMRDAVNLAEATYDYVHIPL